MQSPNVLSHDVCRELSETILDSGDTLLTILGDILDFSKIDHNSMLLESAPVRPARPPLSCTLHPPHMYAPIPTSWKRSPCAHDLFILWFCSMSQAALATRMHDVAD